MEEPSRMETRRVVFLPKRSAGRKAPVGLKKCEKTNPFLNPAGTSLPAGFRFQKKLPLTNESFQTHCLSFSDGFAFQ